MLNKQNLSIENDSLIILQYCILQIKKGVWIKLVQSQVKQKSTLKSISLVEYGLV